MSEAIIPLAGIMLPMVLVPTIMGIRHARQKREWEHAERMKALDLGQPLPGGEVWPSAAAIAIGAVVPISALLIALIGGLAGAHEEVAVPSTLVGFSGVIGGSILATRLIGNRNRAKRQDLYANGKPHMDPDAYDVVGRRG
jgi:hypothetical protein